MMDKMKNSGFSEYTGDVGLTRKKTTAIKKVEQEDPKWI